MTCEFSEKFNDHNVILKGLGEDGFMFKLTELYSSFSIYGNNNYLASLNRKTACLNFSVCRNSAGFWHNVMDSQ